MRPDPLTDFQKDNHVTGNLSSTTTSLTKRPRAASAKRAAPATPGGGRYPQALLHHIVAPSLRIPEAAAASVFSAARLRGPIARDVIAQVTQLSIATVNRQVTALLDAELLRERADLAVSGAIGRPRVPVEVNHEPLFALTKASGSVIRQKNLIAA